MEALSQDPLYLRKVVSQFYRSREIILPSFCENLRNERQEKFNSLDVRRFLLMYLDTVKDFGKSNHLLVLCSGSKKGRRLDQQWPGVLDRPIGIAYKQLGPQYQPILKLIPQDHWWPLGRSLNRTNPSNCHMGKAEYLLETLHSGTVVGIWQKKVL